MNRQSILNYLMILGEADNETNKLIGECIEEVKELSLFKYIYKEVNLTHSPLMISEIEMALESDDLNLYFNDCHSALLVGCTLGSEVDRKLRYYQYDNLAKAVVFDAVCNAYLEEMADAYEDTLDLPQRTFRFCPGYGDIPLEYNVPISSYLNIEKNLFVHINQAGLFVPLKTMVGIIGIGKEVKKTCLSCMKLDTCQLRKEGKTCYVKK